MFHKIDKITSRMMIALKFGIKEFTTKENGDVNIVSIIVLIGIAVLLAVLFKDRIGALVNTMFDTINKSTNDAMNSF